MTAEEKILELMELTLSEKNGQCRGSKPYLDLVSLLKSDDIYLYAFINRFYIEYKHQPVLFFNMILADTFDIYEDLRTNTELYNKVKPSLYSYLRSRKLNKI